jgi:hypothetical protein
MPKVFLSFIPQLPYIHTKPDVLVFAYVAGITLVAGSITALVPSVESLRVNLLNTLNGQGTTSTARSRTWRTLIVAQVGMLATFVPSLPEN